MKTNNKAMCINRCESTVGSVLRALLIIAILIPYAEGCDYKPLVYDSSHQVTIDVVYDWEDAPEAYPEGMCIYVYNEDGSFYDRWDFSATKASGSHVQGGQIRLPAGTYSVITYNNDTEAVLFSGTDEFFGHLAYTREGDIFEPVYGNSSGSNSLGSRADDESDERAVISPDMMWGVWATRVEITESAISYTTTRSGPQTVTKTGDSSMTLILYPQELVCTYTYEVINITNIKYASLMSGTLSALAPSEYLGTWELGEESVTVPFSGSISADDATMTGGFYTFGNNENNFDPHIMVIYVWLTNGDKYYFTYDVTGQVDGAEDPKHVHIVIDGMSLPIAISNGEGFHPSVDDWQNEDHDIIL